MPADKETSTKSPDLAMPDLSTAAPCLSLSCETIQKRLACLLLKLLLRGLTQPPSQPPASASPASSRAAALPELYSSFSYDFVGSCLTGPTSASPSRPYESAYPAPYSGFSCGFVGSCVTGSYFSFSRKVMPLSSPPVSIMCRSSVIWPTISVAW